MENKEKFVLPKIEIISLTSNDILTTSFGDAQMPGYIEDDDLL